MSNRCEFTEALLEACRCLGPVRVVMRNAVGFTEFFANLEGLKLEGSWAHLIQDGSHIHLTPRSFGAVAFRTVQSEGGKAAPAIWLYGSAGCPLLLFVLDQTQGDASYEQRAAYRQLQKSYGPFLHLMSRQESHGIEFNAEPGPTAASPMH